MVGGIDHDCEALACVIGGCTDDSGAQNDMAPDITMDDAVEHLHGHRREAVDGLGGTLTISRTQMRQDEFRTGTAINGLASI